MMPKQQDSSMAKVRALFDKSGLSLQTLGVQMEYPKETARQSAFQFLKGGDPRIGSLRRFAKAMGIHIEDLVSEQKKTKR